MVTTPENYVYPRVKVREQEQDDGLRPADESNDSLLLLKVIDSVPVKDCHSPVKGNNNDDSSNVALSLNSASKGTKKNNNAIPNAGANSVFRPRAVLSSPDNDGMIGSINKLTTRRTSPMEKLSVQKKSPSRAKLTPCQVKIESPLRKRLGLREAPDNKSGFRQRESLKPAVLRQETYFGKQNSDASLL